MIEGLKDTRKATRSGFVLLGADEQHLRALPVEQSEPICLVHTGVGYKAAAEQLQIPINTLKTRIHRGRAAILAMRAANQEEANGA